ncbi:methyltransferase family protein [Hoeflea marina]|uniref:Methyltransferase family protein n=1 Tax=Hoeflea marina TaxID=274592 RepID=A0A317PN94_9HYPH|nr:class I SAM-dependent methyltransferase [Hoeflea marina]PWV99960.1 methyltransferase family protein [Hoeflea marina]
MRTCRHCAGAEFVPFLDLGEAPPSNAYLASGDLDRPEKRYPLVIRTCTGCWLTQTEDFADREEFFSGDYAYFSSFSSTWLAHARAYVEAMTARFALGPQSRVVEIAANDGYLLQYVRSAGIPCYGVEPTAGTAAAARALGIDIVEDFFGLSLGRRLAEAGRGADLIAANNVLAHVPDINDFVAGFAALLKPDGVATFEFPHLLEMVRGNQFDTAYHEHYSYLSLIAVERVFRANGLVVFDVETTPHHGGSLRVLACRADCGSHPETPAVAAQLSAERLAGMDTPAFYTGFQGQAERLRDEFRAFLARARARRQTVAAYGAAAKGNTLLNFADVSTESIAFVVDRNPAKQGRFLPGSHIPIHAEAALADQKPDWVVILPWNLETEIKSQLSYISDWGGRFVTAIPCLTLHPQASTR